MTLARAEEADTALRHRGTVLNALRGVEDALVTYRPVMPDGVDLRSVGALLYKNAVV